MATVQGAASAFDVTQTFVDIANALLFASEADIITATNDTIQVLTPQGTVLTSFGSFTYFSDGSLRSGTFTGFSEASGGVTLYEMTGLSITAPQFIIHGFFEGDLAEFALRGNDSINGSSEADALYGFAGTDILDGGAGSDAMAGGAGNDTYMVGEAGDTVTEEVNGGTDTVQSAISLVLPDNVERMVLTGDADIDGTGNALKNALTGNAGANRLDGGAGADVMTGGLGDDTYVVDNIGDKAKEASTTGGIDTVESGFSFTLRGNLENLTLTGSGNFNATGNALTNELSGNSGDNLLNGKAGADAMAGGAGNDTYVVDDLGDAVTELLSGGTDLVRSTVGQVLGANVENLTLLGSAAVNGTGNDLGNILTGNSGANILEGLTGADQLFGGDRNDRLDGGADADVMSGGGGNDVFVLSLGEASGDSILDFRGNGSSLGDSLLLQGYGDGAVLTNSGDDWTIVYDGGASSETFEIAGVTALDTSDYFFV